MCAWRWKIMKGIGPSKKKYDADSMIIHPLTLERQ
jgi:hypothetical protein